MSAGRQGSWNLGLGTQGFFLSPFAGMQVGKVSGAGGGADSEATSAPDTRRGRGSVL